MKQRRILVNVIANKTIGLGHVYNILTILPIFKRDKIFVVMNKKNSLGILKFREKKYRIKTYKNEEGLLELIKNFKPDIVMNDILNTKSSYIIKLQKMKYFIINFEDLGDGSNYANLVFNPIYYGKSTQTKFFGEKYACVREEFRKKQIRLRRKGVVITFGGVDPKKLTLRLLKILENYNPRYQIRVIIGNEFTHKKKIFELINKLKKKHFNIEGIIKSEKISQFIDGSLFAVTANGRTVFEIAALQIPIISISANKREEMHEFPIRRKVGYHLGLHSNVTDKKIFECLKKMEENQNRLKFVKELEKMNLKNSMQNVKKKINEEYKKWSKEIKKCKGRK